MTKKTGILFSLLFSLLFTQLSYCLAVNQNQIIGNWQGDFDLYMADPQTIAEVEQQSAREEYVSFIKEYYNLMKVAITNDTLTIDIEGVKSDTSKYQTIASTDQTITIKTDEDSLQTVIIQIIDPKHLKLSMVENGAESTLCYIKKAQ